MAFLTVEDLAGSVEVLVFPKDYEKRRDMLIKDEKVFIRGRASVGDEPVGKLICEQIIPFSQVPRELWIQYADKDAYLAGEKELLDLLKTSDGNDTVIIYLGRERAKKVLRGARDDAQRDAGREERQGGGEAAGEDFFISVKICIGHWKLW